jgi:hypothetical protein
MSDTAAAFRYDLAPAVDSPAVDARFRGVVVRTAERVAGDGEWYLRGVFQLHADELAAIDAHPHRALVLVATLGSSWYADSPLRDRIFFPDDLQAVGGLVRGYFSFELFSLFQARVPGHYWVSVSLGEYLSPVLAVEVG